MNITDFILSESVLIRTPRYLLRDFTEADREAFVSYQQSARYRALYNLDDDRRRADELFSLFLEWQCPTPRENIQLGIFGQTDNGLCGCVGLRLAGRTDGAAELGIELAPDNWGRYRLAIEAVEAIGEYGFGSLKLQQIVATTTDGNARVAKLACWFGARQIATREGPGWMQARGWHEIDWSVDRQRWYGYRGRNPRDRRRRK